MKPHPRIRKTVKWNGAAITALLIATWLGSGWSAFCPYSSNDTWVEIWAGRASIHKYLAPPSPDSIHAAPPYRLDWWFSFCGGAGSWDCYIPLWLPAALSLLITAVAWRLDSLARRRASLNLCPTCRYDRTGLPTLAPCPECGVAPAPHS